MTLKANKNKHSSFSFIVDMIPQVYFWEVEYLSKPSRNVSFPELFGVKRVKYISQKSEKMVNKTMLCTFL